MDLLPLLDIGIELCDTAESEFVHQVNTVRVGYELLAKALDSDRERSTEQTNLVLRVAVGDDLFQNRLEFGRE